MPRKFDFLSPGIEINEVDQSILPAEVDADGPVIIGRFRKGPGMKPAKVRSLDNFVSIYGNPVPGGSSLKGDIWRDGPQLSAPTPAAYAAQAWLASRTSPVNLVRLLGDQHPQATAAGKAGWQLSGSGNLQITNDAATNSTAYGLFVADLSKLGQLNHKLLEFDGTPAISQFHDVKLKITTTKGTFVLQIDVDGANSAKSNTVEKTGALAIKAYAVGLTLTQLMALIETALELAMTENMITNMSLDNNGTSMEIFHLEAGTFSLRTVDGSDSAQADRFHLGGADTSIPRTIATSGVVEPGEGTLAAVFYVNSGYMALSGINAHGATLTEPVADGLVKSVAGVANALTFNAVIYNAAGTAVENVTFNFERTSPDYIRNKFNTNPQLVNTSITATADQKNYWLGETFERSLKDKVTSETAAAQVATLIPLHKDDVVHTTKTGNWGYQRIGSAEAKSGYLIGRNYGANDATYVGESTVSKLFRFECIHAGEEVQKNVLIAIEDLKLATNPTVYPYGTFSVKIMDVNGGTLEKYSGCNLDPNSPNFVARRIGDMYMEWSEADRRYRSYGDHPNVSDYVRIKMYAENQNYDDTDLPIGFLGPGRPKGFGALEGDVNLKSFDLKDDFAGAFATPSIVKASAGNASSEAIELYGSHEAIKFSFPKLPFRVNGSDGFSSNPYKVHFGIRPKIDKDSTLHDPDYCDYLRPLPAEYAQYQFAPSGDFEYSCVFSLNDIVVDTTNNTTTWTSGSMASGASYAATDGLDKLFNKGVKQFVLPLFGGFDGLDITEKEPFRQDLILESLNEKDNYLQYSLNKAIDSVSDPETVPASLIAAPGIKNSIITTKIVRTAEARKDMLAVIDLVGDYKPAAEAEVSDTQVSRLGSVSDTISNLKNRQLDSSYACAYYPAVQIQDNLNNGERVWVPSSVAGIGAMAQSDASAELWFAPAGFNRGGLGNLGGRSGPRVIQARQRLDASERDDLYEVNINPIATFPNEGVVVFGQKTLQQTPSALDRINVRRLMIFLKAEISKVARGVLFDQNVRSTWARFVADAEPILADVKAKFGLTEYRLILDSSTTTAEYIDRNIMYAKVFLKPARAIEYIAIDFVITRTGADFA